MTAFAPVAHGQTENEPAPPKKEPSSDVAVIDIEYVLRHHVPLGCKLADLVKEAEELAKQVSQEQAAIEKKRESLQTWKVDTPQHQEISQEVVKAEAALQAFAEAKRAVFRRQEAKLYYAAYEEICAAVETFSRKHNIVLVLSKNTERPDIDAPEDIEAAIRSPVVYQHRRDITQQIMHLINAGVPAQCPSILFRPVEELRATGLKLPFHRTAKPHFPWPAPSPTE
jgi:Skp family chaperone for outer membrane proteins